MSKIEGVIAELESVLEKLGGVQSRLKEIKEESEAVEKARDSLRRPKSKKSMRPLIALRSSSGTVERPDFYLSFQSRTCFVERSQ